MLQEYKDIEDEIYEFSSGSDSDEKYDRYDMSSKGNFTMKSKTLAATRRTVSDNNSGLFRQYVQMKARSGYKKNP